MNNAIVKIWEGTKDGIKWFLIQACVLLAISLLYYLGLYCYSLFSGIGFREVLMSYPLLGRAGAYNWRTGLCLAIPIYVSIRTSTTVGLSKWDVTLQH